MVVIKEVRVILEGENGERGSRAMKLGRIVLIGPLTEDRKATTREHRLGARREKKKIKADAKRERKQNAIMHRRMVRFHSVIILCY